MALVEQQLNVSNESTEPDCAVDSLPVYHDDTNPVDAIGEYFLYDLATSDSMDQRARGEIELMTLPVEADEEDPSASLPFVSDIDPREFISSTEIDDDGTTDTVYEMKDPVGPQTCNNEECDGFVNDNVTFELLHVVTTLSKEEDVLEEIQAPQENGLEKDHIPLQDIAILPCSVDLEHSSCDGRTITSFQHLWLGFMFRVSSEMI